MSSSEIQGWYVLSLYIRQIMEQALEMFEVKNAILSGLFSEMFPTRQQRKYSFG